MLFSFLFKFQMNCFFVLKTDGVCYEKYGCFDQRPPFNNLLVWLPRPPSAVGTKFYLYTRFSRGDPTVIDDNDEEKLKSSNFVIARRTILIVHGYWGNYRSIWVN